MNSLKTDFVSCMKKNKWFSCLARDLKIKPEKTFLEKDCQALLCKWLKIPTNTFTHNGEVKITSGGTVNFNDFEDQQLPSLDKASGKGLYHKESDLIAAIKPFDYWCRKKDPSYVVIMFYKDKQQEYVYFIDINIVMLIKKLGYKSITEEMAACYGFIEKVQ